MKDKEINANATAISLAVSIVIGYLVLLITKNIFAAIISILLIAMITRPLILYFIDKGKSNILSLLF